MHLEEHSHGFMLFFGVKTLSGTLLGPAFNESVNPGHGTRFDEEKLEEIGEMYVQCKRALELMQEWPRDKKLKNNMWAYNDIPYLEYNLERLERALREDGVEPEEIVEDSDGKLQQQLVSLRGEQGEDPADRYMGITRSRASRRGSTFRTAANVTKNLASMWAWHEKRRSESSDKRSSEDASVEEKRASVEAALGASIRMSVVSRKSIIHNSVDAEDDEESRWKSVKKALSRGSLLNLAREMAKSKVQGHAMPRNPRHLDRIDGIANLKAGRREKHCIVVYTFCTRVTDGFAAKTDV